MAALPLLDANIFVRHLTGDHPDHSPRATAWLERVARRELRVRTLDTIVFETVFTLQSVYRVPRVQISGSLLPILELPGIVLPGKRAYRYAFALYVTHAGLSFADCFHAAAMQRLGIHEIISFDRGFDRLTDVVRIEP